MLDIKQSFIHEQQAELLRFNSIIDEKISNKLEIDTFLEREISLLCPKIFNERLPILNLYQKNINNLNSETFSSYRVYSLIRFISYQFIILILTVTILIVIFQRHQSLYSIQSSIINLSKKDIKNRLDQLNCLENYIESLKYNNYSIEKETYDLSSQGKSLINIKSEKQSKTDAFQIDENKKTKLFSEKKGNLNSRTYRGKKQLKTKIMISGLCYPLLIVILLSLILVLNFTFTSYFNYFELRSSLETNIRGKILFESTQRMLTQFNIMYIVALQSFYKRNHYQEIKIDNISLNAKISALNIELKEQSRFIKIKEEDKELLLLLVSDNDFRIDINNKLHKSICQTIIHGNIQSRKELCFLVDSQISRKGILQTQYLNQERTLNIFQDLSNTNFNKSLIQSIFKTHQFTEWEYALDNLYIPAFYDLEFSFLNHNQYLKQRHQNNDKISKVVSSLILVIYLFGIMVVNLLIRRQIQTVTNLYYLVSVETIISNYKIRTVFLKLHKLKLL